MSMFHGRRHDIDNMRNIAFLLLIVYHCGMYFVADWGWHIKSANESVWLQNLMLWSAPWRMSLIFLISGLALRYAEQSFPPFELLRLRLTRLLVPLIFGMYVIVAPQLFFELQQGHGYTGSYLEFLSLYWAEEGDSFPEYRHAGSLITWNHLWYLAYLLLFTLAFLILRPLLKRLADRLDRCSIYGLGLIAVPAVSLAALGNWLQADYPSNHAIIGDWFNLARYFLVFVLGYCFARNSSCWAFLKAWRFWILAAAVTTYIGVLLVHNGVIPTEPTNATQWAALQLWGKSNAWLWILSACAFSHTYLDRQGALGRYFQQAVLPWYILHQSYIIIIAMALKPLALGGGAEFLVIFVATVIACYLSYEIIRRLTLLRFLFGLKIQTDLKGLLIYRPS